MTLLAKENERLRKDLDESNKRNLLDVKRLADIVIAYDDLKKENEEAMK